MHPFAAAGTAMKLCPSTVNCTQAPLALCTCTHRQAAAVATAEPLLLRRCTALVGPAIRPSHTASKVLCLRRVSSHGSHMPSVVQNRRNVRGQRSQRWTPAAETAAEHSPGLGPEHADTASGRHPRCPRRPAVKSARTNTVTATSRAGQMRRMSLCVHPSMTEAFRTVTGFWTNAYARRARGSLVRVPPRHPLMGYLRSHSWLRLWRCAATWGARELNMHPRRRPADLHISASGKPVAGTDCSSRSSSRPTNLGR